LELLFFLIALLDGFTGIVPGERPVDVRQAQTAVLQAAEQASPEVAGSMAATVAAVRTEASANRASAAPAPMLRPARTVAPRDLAPVDERRRE
jgi:hypothetical protein